MVLVEMLGHTSSAVGHSGLGLGAALAVVLSWDRNRSILWAIIHGLLSWIYVIYFAVTRDVRVPNKMSDPGTGVVTEWDDRAEE